MVSWSRRAKLTLGGVIGLSAGCASDRLILPAGHLPPSAAVSDANSGVVLSASPAPELPPSPAGKSNPFDLPNAIPGAGLPPVAVPKFGKDVPAAERSALVRKAYPDLTPVSAALPAGTALGLAELQQLAVANHPVVRKAEAEAEAALGQVVQAGLHPNPTVGYQVDQWQPKLNIPPGSTGSGAGQQGGFINQLIKTAGKLGLAQQVAGYDYINALVAVRKARVEVTAQVRAAYFTAVVAQRGVEVNQALAGLADEVYQLQLKRVAAGEAAAHEPFQFHAQAVQARNAVAQAEATYKAAWRQLAAATGQPDLAPAPLAGRADTPAPTFDADVLRARVLEQHTDLLTARNQIAQARANITLQRRLPIPDLQTNTYQQYDNLAQTYQFGIQLGIQLPISDRNQGNIRTARARVAAAGESLRATENDLQGKLAEAFGRYEANVKIARSYREQVLPDLVQAYRGLVRQFQVEPEKVGFNDIVVAQQNISQAIQAYQAALEAQWKAVVDLSAIGQLDELYPEVPPAR